MTGGQDTNSKAQAESGENLKDGAPKQAALNEALPDDQLDAVSGGGAYPMVITTYANTGIGG